MTTERIMIATPAPTLLLPRVIKTQLFERIAEDQGLATGDNWREDVKEWLVSRSKNTD